MDDHPRPPSGNDAFHRELAAAFMRGQWQNEAVRSTGAGGVEVVEKGVYGPKPGGVAHLWPWAQTREFVAKAQIAVPESFTSRRALMFNNPGLPKGTTTGINMGFQSIRPGELAWAHRHSISALRFVVEGSSSLVTVVDGLECPMEPNDLVLTPAWRWHDHANSAATQGLWLDVLDGPLVGAMNQVFFENFGAERQPAGAPTLPPDNVIAAKIGKRMIFPWREMEPRLHGMSREAGSPYDGVVLEYCDQATGAPVMPSLACWAQMLRPGEATQRHRHTSSAVYYVISGRGRTQVGDVELTWGPRDVFCVPNWAWHSHANLSDSEPAVLFSVSDAPLLRYLGLYREEPEVSIAREFAPPPDGFFARKP